MLKLVEIAVTINCSRQSTEFRSLCIANQWTGFDMIRTFFLKELWKKNLRHEKKNECLGGLRVFATDTWYLLGGLAMFLVSKRLQNKIWLWWLNFKYLSWPLLSKQPNSIDFCDVLILVNYSNNVTRN